MMPRNDYEHAIAGERVLLYVDVRTGYREFHRYSVAEIREIFADCEVESLNDHGHVPARAGGVWIDAVFAAEWYAAQMVAAAAPEGAAA